MVITMGSSEICLGGLTGMGYRLGIFKAAVTKTSLGTNVVGFHCEVWEFGISYWISCDFNE